MIGPPCARCHREGIEVFKLKEGVCPWLCAECIDAIPSPLVPNPDKHWSAR